MDVGVSLDHNLGTAAAICRDRDGAYIGSLVLVVQGLVDPSTLEGLAVREGLALAQHLAMQHIQVASDCKQVISHIRQGVGGNYDWIVKEILETSSVIQEMP